MQWYRIVSLIGFVLVISLLWELIHPLLYVDLTYEPNPLLTPVIDTSFIIIIFLLVYLENKSLDWIDKPQFRDYLTIIGLGFLIALRVEFSAVTMGRWAYAKFMPVLFGIGLIPLFKLFTTAILALFFIRKINPAILKH